MQISKINSNTNFKGLWKVTKIEEGRHSINHSPIKCYKAEYHLFKDEPVQKRGEALVAARRHPVYACYDNPLNDSGDPDFYTITKYVPGDTLNITSKQYQELKQMKETLDQDSKRGSEVYRVSKNRDSAILKLMIKHNVKE